MIVIEASGLADPKVLTGFTTAHSITLILSAVGAIDLPTRFVEIGNALSIFLCGHREHFLSPRRNVTASLLRARSAWFTAVVFPTFCATSACRKKAARGVCCRSIWASRSRRSRMRTGVSTDNGATQAHGGKRAFGRRVGLASHHEIRLVARRRGGRVLAHRTLVFRVSSCAKESVN